MSTNHFVLEIQNLLVATHDGEIDIGRAPNCAIFVDHDEISRVHATLRQSGQRLEICDRGSANGTFINGVAVFEWTNIYPGDDVRLGLIPMRIRRGSAESARKPTAVTHQVEQVGAALPDAKATMMGSPAQRLPK